MNETIELLRRHRTIRRFTSDPLPETHVRAAFEAGQRASTSSAVQAYSAIRVRDASQRRRLAELTGGQEKVETAAAFFVICADSRRHRLAAQRARVPYAIRLEGFLVGVIDAALFAQNVAVAFESLGYGICYVGGLRNRLFEVDALLEIPEGVYPLFGLCVGRPAEDPLPRPRLPLDAVLFDGRYPDDATVLEWIDAHDAEVRVDRERRGLEAFDWSARVAASYAEPHRTDLARYYASKGADLG